MSVSIRYKNGTDNKDLWEAFEKSLGKPFSGVKYSYALVSSAFLMLYQLIGIMLLLFSVILLLIALYILSSSIKDAVISDYKTIGILKSMGFTPGNVVFIYTLQMGAISLLSIPIGIALSNFSIQAVMASLLKALGMVDMNMPLAAIFILAFVFLFSMILLSAFLSSQKAGKVKSAENSAFLGTNTAKTYKKKLDDDFTLYVEGKKLSFKVVGIYQSFNNMGQGYRIQTVAVKDANPAYEPDSSLAKLKDSKEMDAFKGDMEKLFGATIDAKETKEMFSRVMKPILASMGMALAFICFIFVLVLVITMLLTQLCSVMGIVSFPTSTHVLGTLLVIPFSLLVAFICSWIPSGQTMKISARALVSE